MCCIVSNSVKPTFDYIRRKNADISRKSVEEEYFVNEAEHLERREDTHNTSTTTSV